MISKNPIDSQLSLYTISREYQPEVKLSQANCNSVSTMLMSCEKMFVMTPTSVDTIYENFALVTCQNEHQSLDAEKMELTYHMRAFS
jgi:hypothetical protein